MADKLWESMRGVRSLFKLHKVAVEEYLQAKKPACEPPPRWWEQIMIVEYFASRTTINLKQLQGHAVTVYMNNSLLASMQTLYLLAVDEKGPLKEY